MIILRLGADITTDQFHHCTKWIEPEVLVEYDKTVCGFAITVTEAAPGKVNRIFKELAACHVIDDKLLKSKDILT